MRKSTFYFPHALKEFLAGARAYAVLLPHKKRGNLKRRIERDKPQVGAFIHLQQVVDTQGACFASAHKMRRVSYKVEVPYHVQRFGAQNAI